MSVLSSVAGISVSQERRAREFLSWDLSYGSGEVVMAFYFDPEGGKCPYKVECMDSGRVRVMYFRNAAQVIQTACEYHSVVCPDSDDCVLADFIGILAGRIAGLHR